MIASGNEVDFHVAAENLGITAQGGEGRQVFACCLQPTDGTAGSAHAQGHLFLGQPCLLAGIEELTQQAKFHSCFLPGFQVARDLLNPGAFDLAVAGKGFVGDVSHGV